MLHSIRESHALAEPLRVAANPLAALKEAAAASASPAVRAVLLFGSIARREATAASDVDLAVVTREEWDGRLELEDRVIGISGNACDVLVFDEREFARLAAQGEPVVAEILRDGIALVGTRPRLRRGAVVW
jgi:predicted nucleotidyltransferase